jgi:hypothetical protein
MKYKLILFIIIFFTIYKINKILKNNIYVDHDIVYDTGGYYGFYQLGICHYIKNNFNYLDKTTLGISAGSWLSLFMSLDKEHTLFFLKSLFSNIDYICPIQKMPQLFKNTIYNLNCNDSINIKNMNILVTDLNNLKMVIHNNFLSLEDAMNCCTASSFVPFITYNDLFYFYKHTSCMDGGLLKKVCFKLKDPEKTLVIKYKMFGRYAKYKPLKPFIKPKRSLYELYLLGYHDASKNHDYLQKYF